MCFVYRVIRTLASRSSLNAARLMRALSDFIFPPIHVSIAARILNQAQNPVNSPTFFEFSSKNWYFYRICPKNSICPKLKKKY
jgi:hypothetical protein